MDHAAALTTEPLPVDPAAGERRRDWRIGLLLALGILLFYSPSLTQPWDFDDDGALAYSPAHGQGIGAHWAQVWARTVADARGRGPFRPVLWATIEFQEWAFGQNTMAWRVLRLAWVGVTALLLWRLLRTLEIPRGAAAFIVALSLTAMRRSSIWYRLTHGEGTAEPLLLLALAAAAAAAKRRGWRAWGCDALGLLCMVQALLIKNVFVAVIPAQIVLRLWRPGRSFGEGLRRGWAAAGAMGLLCLLPAAHLLYFAQYTHAHSEYQLAAPGLRTLWSMIQAVILSEGFDFTGPGLVLLLLGVLAAPAARQRVFGAAHRPAWTAALLLAGAGIMVYLPVIRPGGQPGRYTIPAVLGGDLMIGLMLMGLPLIRPTGWRRLTATLLGGGLALVLVMSQYQEQAYIVNCRQLWAAVQWLATQTPPGTPQRVGVLPKTMARTEAIHFQWHLNGQGRPEVVLAPLGEAPTEATLVMMPAGRQAPAGFERVAAIRQPLGAWRFLPRVWRKSWPGPIEIWRREGVKAQ